MTQEFLGELLGTRRSTVTVSAGTLQKAGLIEYRRGHVRILDRTGLEDAACECYPMLRASTTICTGTDPVILGKAGEQLPYSAEHGRWVICEKGQGLFDVSGAADPDAGDACLRTVLPDDIEAAFVLGCREAMAHQDQVVGPADVALEIRDAGGCDESGELA